MMGSRDVYALCRGTLKISKRGDRHFVAQMFYFASDGIILRPSQRIAKMHIEQPRAVQNWRPASAEPSDQSASQPVFAMDQQMSGTRGSVKIKIGLLHMENNGIFKLAAEYRDASVLHTDIRHQRRDTHPQDRDYFQARLQTTSGSSSSTTARPERVAAFLSCLWPFGLQRRRQEGRRWVRAGL